MLDLLAHYEVTAMFCLIGEQIRDNKKQFQMMAAAGHEIADHTWTHPLNIGRLSRARADAEIAPTRQAITEFTGKAPGCSARPAGSGRTRCTLRSPRTGCIRSTGGSPTGLGATGHRPDRVPDARRPARRHPALPRRRRRPLGNDPGIAYRDPRLKEPQPTIRRTVERHGPNRGCPSDHRVRPVMGLAALAHFKPRWRAPQLRRLARIPRTARTGERPGRFEGFDPGVRHRVPYGEPGCRELRHGMELSASERWSIQRGARR